MLTAVVCVSVLVLNIWAVRCDISVLTALWATASDTVENDQMKDDVDSHFLRRAVRIETALHTVVSASVIILICSDSLLKLKKGLKMKCVYLSAWKKMTLPIQISSITKLWRAIPKQPFHWLISQSKLQRWIFHTRQIWIKTSWLFHSCTVPLNNFRSHQLNPA